MSEVSSGAASAATPAGEAIVYLRTALDPAPVVTSADAFRGFLGSASRWLRRNGVGPARRRLAAGAQLHRDVGRLLGGDEFGRRAAAQSALHPRGDRRAGRRGRGQDSVRAAARRARRPVREGRGAAGAGAPPRAHRRAAARRNHRLRRRGDRSRRRCERTRRESAEVGRTGSRRRAAADRRNDRARPRWFRSPTATWCPPRSPRCSPANFAPTIA